MNWGVGDFQFLKSGSDEPCIQPIESSQLAANCVRWGRFPILPLRCKPVPCGTSTIC
ncbi:hypothetical protein [Bordetella pertussis]|uniref:hypothetical protein n=1 Tax=Bordetella pertussis TaxID=520 RepID=UPI0002D46A4D|nr:hypothetical protein [Bordetella pertussis]UEB57587.1 hypothetical protein LK428_15965 [Bordetella pertussis]WIQ22516.1 hypothetical protein HDM22_14525 [Bordetella pertussis]WNR17534.1 hypothetical protein PV009_05145 [Bordetella pertussis]WNR23161.1 hypothetical protein PV011_15720 [Bordetella pertussis]